MRKRISIFTARLSAHPVWALVAAFGAYFCMYGFRKPYTAAGYSEASFWGIDYKVLLVIAQTFGYAISKWVGIKVIAEIEAARRIKMLLGMLCLAELMLCCFGLIPRPWNIACLLLNGLFLGIVFGLVLGFLEGRKNTEALVAGLCASFIVSDGFSKSAGSLLLEKGFTENWMPAVAGALFFIPSLFFIAMLAIVPAPSAADIASRAARVPMPAMARRQFYAKYAPGLTGIIIVYLFVTLLRSVRADFAPELWHDLGFQHSPAIFTQSELLVSFGVVIINGSTIFILRHTRAFRLSLLYSLIGIMTILLAIAGWYNGLPPFAFMVMLGLGVYIPYVAIHTSIFERLLAITREKANIGFLMYIADAVGYTGYIVLMLMRYLSPPGISVLSLFLQVCIYLGVSGAIIILYCGWYFKMKLKNNEQAITGVPAGQGSYI